MMNYAHLINHARAWITRKNGPDEVVRILFDISNKDAALCYQLYTAYDGQPDYLGRILFDMHGYWIYDGNTLCIAEQEQLVRFIVNYQEII